MIYLAGFLDSPTYPGKYYSIAINPIPKKNPYPKIECFVPTKEMATNYLFGHFYDKKDYIDDYSKLMFERKKEIKDFFRSLDHNEDQVWVCFCQQYETKDHEICGHRNFCHRLLVAKIIKLYCPNITLEVH